MFKNFRMLFVVGIVALGLAVPMMASAQEIPAAPASGPGVCLVSDASAQSPAPNGAPQKPAIDLQALEGMKKPVRMCGIFCGRNAPEPVNCSLACGDAALCWHGSCIYQ
jgi:hypothetical protein